MGGGAGGYYALGGGAVGVYADTGNMANPAATAAFQNLDFWIPKWIYLVQMVAAAAFSSGVLAQLSSACNGEDQHEADEAGERRFGRQMLAAKDGDTALSGQKSSAVRVIAIMFVFASLLSICLIFSLIFYVRSAQTDSSQQATSVQTNLEAAEVVESEFQPGLPIENPELSSATVKSIENDLMLTEDGVRLSSFFATRMKMNLSQVERVNDALSKTHSEYLKLESTHTITSETDDGRWLTTIKGFPAEFSRLEDQLWSELDVILNVEQQTSFRRSLDLYAKRRARGNSQVAQDIVRPKLLGWGGEPAFVEIWQVGKWFHWQVHALGLTHEGRAPELPPEYERFRKAER